MMSERGGEFITGLFCPSCGYDMTGHERAARVRCPECGAKWQFAHLAINRPASRRSSSLSQTRKRGSPIVIVGIAFVSLIAIYLFLPSLPNEHSRDRARDLKSAAQLKAIHQAAIIHEKEFGQMPEHVALLMATNYAGPELYLDPMMNSNRLMLGGHDLLSIVWSPDNISELRKRIEEMDLASSAYPFGDYHFVAWKSGQLDPRLVYCWSNPRTDGSRRVVFMDNTAPSVPQNEWQQMWDRDAAARLEFGLPALSRTVATGEDE